MSKAMAVALGVALVLTASSRATYAQIAPGTLDPARDLGRLSPAPSTHLREQFIWTKDDAAALNPAYQARVRGQDDKIAPHWFRAHFHVAAVPKDATLYLAGPRSATIFLNGIEIVHFSDDGKSAKGFRVTTADVAQALRPGENVLAMEEVRGHSSLHTGASPTINQVTYGEVLALKIVPAGIAVDAPPLLATDATWRSTLDPGSGWSIPALDDSAWPLVQTLGALGSKSDFLQWSADAGLYAWPGYVGMGAAMRTFRLPVVSTQGAVVDFGREVAGRIHFVSTSNATETIETSYGESQEEAMGHAYLGPRIVTIPPHGEAFGPKSAFRYTQLKYLSGSSATTKVDVEGIAYPVEYRGAFESSDPLLNRIWETGAYTAHLCMQEGIWDAPKRDRGQWMGDLDVTGRVISAVFGERPLMERTMAQVIGDSPVTRDINTIAGYSALWITGQADFYRHSGDLAYLKTMHTRLLELLRVMDREQDAAGFFTNPDKHKLFVDWSTGFNADTPEARAATQLEFYLAYREAVYLLTELGDTAQAVNYRQRAELIRSSAQSQLVDTQEETFGTRWQTNAMAVVSGAATPEQRQAIWQRVLAHVGDPGPVVTPYYGFYVLDAMAKLGHRPEALTWMRDYWGGMLAEGATSFWEAYDPRWPKQDFHAYLEADNKKGYYVSLAHGWASGPTAWLMQQILGIEPTGAGFRTVTIRPDLAGLDWAKGSEPTPRGLILVSATPDKIVITLPAETIARVELPFDPKRGAILQNGRAVASTVEGGRSVVRIRHAGQYSFTYKESR